MKVPTIIYKSVLRSSYWKHLTKWLSYSVNTWLELTIFRKTGHNVTPERCPLLKSVNVEHRPKLCNPIAIIKSPYEQNILELGANNIQQNVSLLFSRELETSFLTSNPQFKKIIICFKNTTSICFPIASIVNTMTAWNK